MAILRTKHVTAIARAQTTTVKLEQTRAGRLRATKAEYDTLAAMLKEAARPNTFEGRIADIERGLHAWLATRADDTDAAPLTKRWYAKQICCGDQVTRRGPACTNGGVEVPPVRARAGVCP